MARPIIYTKTLTSKILISSMIALVDTSPRINAEEPLYSMTMTLQKLVNGYSMKARRKKKRILKSTNTKIIRSYLKHRLRATSNKRI